MEQFCRTEMLFGQENMEKLKNSTVAVFGIGGVGGHVVEALARSGVGHIHIVDHDTVALSNINRQIIATMDTVGREKVEVMRERILSINPEADVIMHNCFFLPENKDDFDFASFDYVVDAIDTVTGKLSLIEEAKKVNVPVISAMGAGNKLDPTGFMVADISKTSVCPLAKVMRRELKKRGIDHVKVVYSKEEAIQPNVEPKENTGRRATPGSCAFVPSVMGLIIAGEVIKDICNGETK